MASNKIITNYEMEWKRNKATVVWLEELSEIFVKEMRIIGFRLYDRTWTFKIWGTSAAHLTAIFVNGKHNGNISL